MMAESEKRPRPRQARESARYWGLLTEAQTATGWIIIVILGALLGAIYLNQTSAIARIGREVQRDLNFLDEIRWKNGDLEYQIGKAQALERLKAEAARLGYVPAMPGDIDYLVIPNYPLEDASSQDEMQTPETISAPPDTIWEALTITLKGMGIDLTRGEASE